MIHRVKKLLLVTSFSTFALCGTKKRVYKRHVNRERLLLQAQTKELESISEKLHTINQAYLEILKELQEINSRPELGNTYAQQYKNEEA